MINKKEWDNSKCKDCKKLKETMVDYEGKQLIRCYYYLGWRLPKYVCGGFPK